MMKLVLCFQGWMDSWNAVHSIRKMALILPSGAVY